MTKTSDTRTFQREREREERDKREGERAGQSKVHPRRETQYYKYKQLL